MLRFPLLPARSALLRFHRVCGRGIIGLSLPPQAVNGNEQCLSLIRKLSSLGSAKKRAMKTFCSKSAPWLAMLVVSALALAPRAHCQTRPQIDLQLSNGFARLSITGDVGSGCTIQSVANLSQNWQFVTNFTLPSNPFLLVDGAGLGAGQRFY